MKLYVTYSKVSSKLLQSSVALVQYSETNTFHTICVCSNANPLHYYVLRIPRKADDGVEGGLFSIHAPLGQITLHEG